MQPDNPEDEGCDVILEEDVKSVYQRQLRQNEINQEIVDRRLNFEGKIPPNCYETGKLSEKSYHVDPRFNHSLMSGTITH